MVDDQGTTEESGSSGGGPAAGDNSCPMCDADLFKRHCKYVCPQHGVVVDCSDPFSF